MLAAMDGTVMISARADNEPDFVKVLLWCFGPTHTSWYILRDGHVLGSGAEPFVWSSAASLPEENLQGFDRVRSVCSAQSNIRNDVDRDAIVGESQVFLRDSDLLDDDYEPGITYADATMTATPRPGFMDFSQESEESRNVFTFALSAGAQAVGFFRATLEPNEIPAISTVEPQVSNVKVYKLTDQAYGHPCDTMCGLPSVSRLWRTPLALAASCDVTGVVDVDTEFKLRVEEDVIANTNTPESRVPIQHTRDADIVRCVYSSLSHHLSAPEE
jgi:hypothetical protein